MLDDRTVALSFNYSNYQHTESAQRWECVVRPVAVLIPWYTYVLHEIYTQTHWVPCSRIFRRMSSAKGVRNRRRGKRGEWCRGCQGHAHYTLFLSSIQWDHWRLRNLGFIHVLLKEAQPVNLTTRNSICNTIHQKASTSPGPQTGARANEKWRGKT